MRKLRVTKLVFLLVGVLVGPPLAHADTLYTCQDVGNLILRQDSLTVDGVVFETLETLKDGGVKATHMLEGGRIRWTASLTKDARGQIIFIFISSAANGAGWEPIRMETHECRKP